MRKAIFQLVAALILSGTAHAQSVWDLAAYGSAPGISHVQLHGYNGGITTTYEAVWPESGAYTVLSAAMSSPYCASTDNTNDKAAGTGCLTMRVSGVNTSYAEFSETVTLNGQTSVTLTTSNVLFINKLECLTTGSSFANTGTIRCGTGSNTAGVPAVVHAHMIIGVGQSQSAMYAVPDNHTLLCRNGTADSYGVTAAQTVQFAIDRFVDPVSAKVLQREYFGSLNQAGSSSFTKPNYHVFEEKTVFLAQALSAASTGPVGFEFECLLIDLGTSNNLQVKF
jgi:hypothetical protein